MAFHPCVRSVAQIWRTNRSRWRLRLPCWLKLHCSSVATSSDFTCGPPDTSQDPPSGSAEKPPHTPVMLKEVLHYLDIQPDEVVLDMTFGGGGHTRAILNAVPRVKVVALDRDPAAIALAERLAEEHCGRVKPLLGRFSELEAMQVDVEPGSVDAALLDAGCSSMQMDQALRGFSLSKDGPLDMRMDGERYPDMPSAADVVNTLDQQALASILAAYGEERRAWRIAAAVVEARRAAPITGTRQLAAVVAGAFPAAVAQARRDRLQRPAHVATKTFQALRILVNDELNELHAGLRAARRLLRPGGRLCVLTFHSLEDRLVKRFLRDQDLSGWDPLAPGSQGAGRAAGDGHWLPLRRKVVTPERGEVDENPRGRSAKLRAALRL